MCLVLTGLHALSYRPQMLHPLRLGLGFVGQECWVRPLLIIEKVGDVLAEPSLNHKCYELQGSILVIEKGVEDVWTLLWTTSLSTLKSYRATISATNHRKAMRCSVLQCAAVCCSVLQCVAARCSVLQCIAVCCSEWSPTRI